MSQIPIAALSRLNVHARAGFGQRDAIYAYKTLAAITAALEGTASLRFVRWTGKCNRCTNGRYSHWDWRDGYTVRCRDCRGTSINSLYFVETTLPEGHKWHHPWSGRHRPGYEIADAVLGLTYDNDLRDYRTAGGQRIEWQPAGDWSPNKPADHLPLAELVPLLNEVEDWVERAPKPGGGTWVWERAQRHLFTHKPQHYSDPDEYVETYGYGLELGDAPEVCFVCGSSELNSCGYGAFKGRLHWRLRVCDRHFDGPEKAPHPKNPEPPAELITPDIQRWLDRHQRMWPGRW